jgi:hypothetical protein
MIMMHMIGLGGCNGGVASSDFARSGHTADGSFAALMAIT